MPDRHQVRQYSILGPNLEELERHILAEEIGRQVLQQGYKHGEDGRGYAKQHWRERMVQDVQWS
jgi:hypothetical protein